MNNRLGFLTLASIQAGNYICVLAIMIGHVLYTNMGFKSALMGILLGSLSLWMINLFFIRLALVHRKVLIEIAQEYFGERGAKICGLSMGVSLLGWFALQTEVMVKGVTTFYPGAPKALLVILFATIVTINVMKGMKWMGKLADYSVPFLLAIMAYTGWSIYDVTMPIPVSSFQFNGVTLMVASCLAGVIDTPTYFCASRTPRDAYLASTLVYLIVLPCMALLGFALGFYTQAPDFVEGIMGLGSQLWRFLVLLFIILAGWTTNNGNLYSATLALSPWFSIRRNTLVLILGGIGMSLALLGLLDNYTQALGAMSIILAALGAALMSRLITDGFRYNPLTLLDQRAYQSFIFLGTASGLMAHMGWMSFTSFGFIDAFLMTCCLAFSYEAIDRLNDRVRMSHG